MPNFPGSVRLENVPDLSSISANWSNPVYPISQWGPGVAENFPRLIFHLLPEHERGLLQFKSLLCSDRWDIRTA